MAQKATIINQTAFENLEKILCPAFINAGFLCLPRILLTNSCPDDKIISGIQLNGGNR